jgi:hypothetical protein
MSMVVLPDPYRIDAIPPKIAYSRRFRLHRESRMRMVSSIGVEILLAMLGEREKNLLTRDTGNSLFFPKQLVASALNKNP